MKITDEGFRLGALDLDPTKAATPVTPYAVVGPSGAVAISEYPNKQKHATVYRTRKAAERAARLAGSGFMVWERPPYETSSGDGEGLRPSIGGGAANERGDAAQPQGSN